MPATILIVEDHPAVRQALQEWLQTEYPEHLVLVIDSGEEAVEMARSLDLDIIIMDIGLPGMSGIEATRRIKAEKQSRVVIQTTHEEEAYRADAMAAGADAFVAKRMMGTDLLPLLRTLLSSGNETNNSPFVENQPLGEEG
jgi:DNA-binding NarL/FixJ family response regulator